MLPLLVSVYSLATAIVTAQSGIECVNIESGFTEAGVDTIAETGQCRLSHPVMTFCGVTTAHIGDAQFRGSWISSNSTCIAEKHSVTNKEVKAIARCCRFEGVTATCDSIDGVPLNLERDISVNCSDSRLLNPTAPIRDYQLSCTPRYATTGVHKGCYPGDVQPNDTSIIRETDYDMPIGDNNWCHCGSGLQNPINTMQGALVCCDVTNPQLTCKYRYSEPDQRQPAVQCGADYEMVSCMAWSSAETGKINRWFIDNTTTPPTCRGATHQPVELATSIGAYAIAVCCQVTQTQAPTNVPSIDPTSAPTNSTSSPTKYPTSNPTNDPTIDPTVDPTIDPTTDPTVDPTTDPTIDPTVDPTIDPTIDPTSDPTTDPTIDPTIDPTVDPTKYPSMEPTSDPTTDPTVDPTEDPTINPTTNPTMDPTVDPTAETSEPTTNPTNDPTIDPTVDPTTYPTVAPTEECDTMIVNIQTILYNGSAPAQYFNDSNENINIGGAINITHEHWNGHYLENSGSLSYNRPTWSKDSNQDLLNKDGLISWIPNSWVIHSGITGHDLLYLNDRGLHPPTKQVSTWVYYLDYDIKAYIELECSDSVAPTSAPTDLPTDEPTEQPTDVPTDNPTLAPTGSPTDEPTNAPTDEPTEAPSNSPVEAPTGSPTVLPTKAPSNAPTDEPTSAPTAEPTSSPITSCELLRVRVVNVTGGGNLTHYKSELDSSFEQQYHFIANYRTVFLRLSDAAKIEYNSNNEWTIITSTGEILSISSTQEMPPSNGIWTSSQNATIQIEINTQCVLYTDEPSVDPTEIPSSNPTEIPTEATSNPTTMMPTTDEPTTAEPTININPCGNDEFIGPELPIEFTLIDNSLKDQQIQRSIENAFGETIGTWNDSWCAVVTLTVDRQENNRRRLLQEINIVKATITMNDLLYEARFVDNPDYDAQVFLDNFENNLEAEIAKAAMGEDGGDAPMLSGFAVSEIIEPTTTTEAPKKDDDDDNLPLGLGGDCGAFGLLCWQLYAFIIGFCCCLMCFSCCFCYKTNKDVQKVKWNEKGDSDNKDVEMQKVPASPTSPDSMVDEAAKTQTGDLDL